MNPKGVGVKTLVEGEPRRWRSRRRSRSSGSDVSASTTSCRVVMSGRLTSGCFSHTCAHMPPV